MEFNIFNKIIEENFPNLKKEMPIKVQGYRTPNQLGQKRKYSHHMIIKIIKAIPTLRSRLLMGGMELRSLSISRRQPQSTGTLG